MSRRSVFALACSLTPGLLALGLVSACTEKDSGSPPPAGMAGAGPASGPAATAQGSEQGRGFGMNPGGAPMGSPHGAASQPAGHAATGMATPHGGAASQPAGAQAGAANPGANPGQGGTAPQVIKGGGQDAVPPPPPAKATVSGEVTETVNAAGYTYMLVKAADGNELWVAVGETQMAVGNKVTVDESVTMRDFHSKTLNRTFPSIIFGTLR